jgi:hypothetical protein
LEQASHFIFEVLKLTFLQFFIVLGPFLIIAFLLHFVSSWFQISLYNLLGERPYHILFGKLSTIIHEFGHAIFCFIFRQKVRYIDLSRDNAHVGREIKPGNVFQFIGEFFVGIGPILLSIAILYLLAFLFFKETILLHFTDLETSYLDFETFESIKRFLRILNTTFFAVIYNFFTAENLMNWKFYIFLYALIIAGDSMALSKNDIRIFLPSLTIPLAVFLIFSIFDQIEGKTTDTYVLYSISKYYSSFISVMLLCLLFNLLINIPLFVLSMLKRMVFHRFYSEYP